MSSTDVQIAGEAIADAQRLAEQLSARLAVAYQEVFDGEPTKDDQELVLRDLEDFCGMRTAMLRGTFHETAEAAGKFRVWQRIHALRHPRKGRPADARIEGGTNGRSEQADNRPVAGGGVAEPTVD